MPLKEAYTHDSASTVDRAVATLDVRGPGAILWRSRPAHSVELQDLFGRLSVEARDRYRGV